MTSTQIARDTCVDRRTPTDRWLQRELTRGRAEHINNSLQVDCTALKMIKVQAGWENKRRENKQPSPPLPGQEQNNTKHQWVLHGIEATAVRPQFCVAACRATHGSRCTQRRPLRHRSEPRPVNGARSRSTAVLCVRWLETVEIQQLSSWAVFFSWR